MQRTKKTEFLALEITFADLYISGSQPVVPKAAASASHTDLLEIHILKKNFFWPQHAACRTFVPQLGIKLMPPAVEAQS